MSPCYACCIAGLTDVIRSSQKVAQFIYEHKTTVLKCVAGAVAVHKTGIINLEALEQCLDAMHSNGQAALVALQAASPASPGS